MGSKLLGWGIWGAVAVAAAGALLFSGTDRLSAPPKSAPPQSGLAQDPTPPDVQPVAQVAPQALPQLADPAPVVAAAPDPAPPRLDLVRSEPGGSTLIAGSAPPGAEVSLLVDGVPRQTAAADSSGRFAQFLDLPPTDAPRVLTLRMSLGGRDIPSADEVVLAAPPPPQAPDQPVPPQAQTQGQPQAQGRAQSQPQAQAMAPDAKPAAPPAIALRSSSEGVELMQPPGPALPPGTVAIDAITYDTAGEVALAGRGRADAQLRIYLDNRSIATAIVPGSGRWQADLPRIDAGTYTLRVDQMDAGGAVTARAESPFLRESPEKLAAAAEEAGSPLSVVTVQPGHTLWALARERYGDGFAYVKVFEANRSQIRDPDLIYPGQVFDLPD